jgi:hypothetical protein
MNPQAAEFSDPLVPLEFVSPQNLRIMYSCEFNVADPDQGHHLDTDPDPPFHFDADLDPTFHFDANPDPAPHQK